MSCSSRRIGSTIGEGLVILVAVMVGTALPIQPTEILWINMTTAVALGLMLAFEPKETGIMARPPRGPGQALLTSTLVFRMLLVSAMLVGGAWWLFEWELDNQASLAEARTAAVNHFVAVGAFHLLNCRSLTQSVWHIGLLSNRWVIVGIGVQAVARLALLRTCHEPHLRDGTAGTGEVAPATDPPRPRARVNRGVERPVRA